MSTAAIVNRILTKLRTGQIKFAVITEKWVEFDFGHNRYCVAYNGDQKQMVCKRSVADETSKPKKKTWVQDEYSNWVAGVLNGMVRGEKGNLVPAK